MARVIENFLGCSNLHDFPGIHHGHPVRHSGHRSQIVGHKHRRRPQLLLNLPQQVQNLGLNGHVQCCGRLVGKENGRVPGQSHGQHAALAHAAGEIMWVKPHPLRGPLNAHQGHQFQNPLPHRLSSHTGLVDPNGFGNLRADGHGGVQRRHGVLKHHGE